MYVEELHFTSFRNYGQESFVPGKNFNLILGKNGMGKTNLLEAIYVSGTGRSFRTTSTKEVIPFEGESAYLKSALMEGSFSHQREIQITPQGRQLFKDNNKVKTLGEYRRGVGIVVFQPLDLNLVHSSPSHRRNFIDSSISMVDPLYEETLKNYLHVLSQRNYALKHLKSEKKLMEVYDQRLAKLGSQLFVRRLREIKKLGKWAREAHNYLSNQEEKLRLNYLSTIPMGEDQREVEKNYYEKLKEKEREDMILGRTTIGPHLDDILFFLNEREAKNFASQGQIRSIVLALKWAEVELLKEYLGKTPIMLLDDVFSELDEGRGRFLLEYFSDLQCFITLTEILPYMEKIDSLRFEIIAGVKKIRQLS